MWIDAKILTSKDLNIIQEKVDFIIVPSKIGRIPRKLGSNFAALIADEWKNWTLVFSVYALDGVLADDHYHCWYTFVKACRLLIQSNLTEIEVSLAHMYLIEFCRTFQQLYGAENCTLNMHMACHLADCVLDYGVLSSFWCFPFERLNGTLEGMKKSWILPEKQMFIKFNNFQNFCSSIVLLRTTVNF